MTTITKKTYCNMQISRKLLVEIDSVLQLNNKTAAHGKKSVRPSTQDNRSADVLKFFSILINKLHFKIESINNLQQKHLEMVFKYLVSKGEKRTTIMNMLTTMRTFCNWIGKSGMVKVMHHYLNSVPTKNIDDNTSPEPNVDPITIIEAINSIGEGKEERVALWLEQCWALGLTINQSIMLRPHVDVNTNLIYVRELSRGGSRMHSLQIKNEVQRDVIERAKLFADRNKGKIGRPGKDITTDLQHFYYVLRKVGISKKLINGSQSNALQNKYLEQKLKILSDYDPSAK